MRVLLVEDDRMIAEAVRTALEQDGHVTDWVGDGSAALAALGHSKFDIVLLDLGLPRKDGLTVLRQLRERGDATVVIIITARDDVRSRVAGLDGGADDYLVKPFDLDELAARMRAALRRSAGRGDPRGPQGRRAGHPVCQGICGAGSAADATGRGTVAGAP